MDTRYCACLLPVAVMHLRTGQDIGKDFAPHQFRAMSCSCGGHSYNRVVNPQVERLQLGPAYDAVSVCCDSCAAES